MSAAEVQLKAEDVIDNVSLPQGKRKADEVEGSEPASKVAKTSENDVATSSPPAFEPKVSAKGRETRLDQNRKAARESRKRKKVMIEELQRSVIFFSRANGALKQQNDELTRHLMQVQMHIAQHNKEKEDKPKEGEKAALVVEEKKALEAAVSKAASDEQKKADTVATQAIFESQGFPAAAARAAAQAVNGSIADGSAAHASSSAGSNLPSMQPGATMQAMANFQQAAAAAMQQAMGQMKGLPGLTQMAATPVGSNPQHAFTDAMTAIAMQQAAAAAAAGQQFMMQNNMQLLPAMVNQMQHTTPEPTAETKEKTPAKAAPESTPDSVAVTAAPSNETTADF
uniref:BZIP domain-containing protein n=1 Tax=Amphora coffeiformis TaxID=265554 RepID=A0A7S3KZK1_9STRA